MLRGDLHIHTVLSPCGDIEMTPSFIVSRAKESGLDIIGITDHNSTMQSREVRRIGEREGLFVMCGAEITTKEEVHVLAFVDGDENIDRLQMYLESHLPKIKNDESVFGYQLVVNEEEEVLYQEEYLLISAIDQSIDQVEAFVHSIGGIFIPAHIDKMQNSIFSQLGFMPPNLKSEALEIYKRTDLDRFLKSNSYLKECTIIKSSDSHYPNELGEAYSYYDIDRASFDGVKQALMSRAVRPCN